MPGEYFIGWLLDRTERDLLLKEITPLYPDVIADHVTLTGRAPAHVQAPPPVKAQIVGAVDDGAGLQAMVVEIDGSSARPDGSIFHITWSLDAARGREAVQSNEVLARLGWSPRAPRRVKLVPVKRERD